MRTEQADARSTQVPTGDNLANRDEEREHASMAPEWIRRPVFSKELLVCLFTNEHIAHG